MCKTQVFSYDRVFWLTWRTWCKVQSCLPYTWSRINWLLHWNTCQRHNEEHNLKKKKQNSSNTHRAKAAHTIASLSAGKCLLLSNPPTLQSFCSSSGMARKQICNRRMTVFNFCFGLLISCFPQLLLYSYSILLTTCSIFHVNSNLARCRRTWVNTDDPVVCFYAQYTELPGF